MGGGTNPPSPSTEVTSSSQALSFRVLTHNIRYATTSPFKGEEPWEVRKPKICAQLLYHTRHDSTGVIFLQEVLVNQFQDIYGSLIARNPSWVILGRGRDDGASAGEFSPICFRLDGWSRITGSDETIWLNETGEVGRTGWDAASVRIVQTVVLECLVTGKRVLFMNTHLDDQGARSREESAKIILEECEKRRKLYDVDAVVLGGDLNSEPNGDAYPIIANYEKSGVVDVRMLANGEEVYGDENTFTGFNGHGDGEQLKRIDFLFLGTKKEDEFNPHVPAYAVLPNRFEDGVYLSDHRAVVADLEI
jgi:hypothetical protein